MKIKIFLIFFLIPLMLSCANDEFPVTLNITQVQRLLTADSSKIWVPVASSAFPSCALEDQYKFTLSKEKDQLSSFTIKRGDIACEGAHQDIDGLWKIDTIRGKNLINLYALDTNSYEIDLITASKLQLKDQNQVIRPFTAQP